MSGAFQQPLRRGEKKLIRSHCRDQVRLIGKFVQNLGDHGFEQSGLAGINCYDCRAACTWGMATARFDSVAQPLRIIATTSVPKQTGIFFIMKAAHFGQPLEE